MGHPKYRFRNPAMRYLITKINPQSQVSEQYRTIRTNIEFAAVDHKIQTLVITSASPGEGKSMTAANLAVVYAQQGKRVLLIDADLRKPTVHYTFCLDNYKGLSNIIVGDALPDEAIVTCDVENLDILTCGPIPPNPSELLTSMRMKAFVYEARKFYDIILCDTPPVLAVSDAQILANLCDGTILVVRCKNTKIEHVQKAIGALKAVNARLIGTILNDSKKRTEDYYYN
ncbi:capsular biosynthesis protein [Mesobacillus boroniphilus]|uniref:non-specific protein-tyrosine kinase n=1 Tax=Mesobacillus boroniphilus TaxID=308892 RepID=A0A944CPF8_9BACI|nr:CpsD/CapB family tyrosine-protein kinase [Mesobacillus boroniphilus]MBS8266565.1 capsular biosynthesis protein [Mesobacillus boroniphilus]